MAFTYNTSLVNLSDHVRAALGDTDSTTPILQDETINAKLAIGYLEGLAQCAEACLAQFATSPTDYKQGSGGEEVQWRDRRATWEAIRDAARAGKIVVPGLPFVRIGAAVAPITAGNQTDSTVVPATGTGPKMFEFRTD